MTDGYKLHKQLSTALYGSIWLATDTQNSNEYAMKQMNLTAMRKNCSLVDKVAVLEDGYLERKVNRLVASKLPTITTIVKLITDFEENGNMNLVFEYCSHGDLFNIVQQKGKLCHSQALQYFHNIVKGVRDLHHIGFAHRDISLENVLIDNEGRAKLCDFGLAAEANTVTNSIVGKPYYMAPEVHAGKRYVPKLADSWSLGVVLSILLTGIPPFEEAALTDARFRLVKKKGIRALFRFWEIEDSIPSGALDLLSKLFAVRPSDRLNVESILNHPWLCGGTSSLNFSWPSKKCDDLKTKNFKDSRIVCSSSSRRSFWKSQRPHERNIMSCFKKSISEIRNKLKRQVISVEA